MNTAPARLPTILRLEITRSRPFCARISGRCQRSAGMVCSPALTALANQAPKLLPQAERPQIVDGCENEQCQDESETPAECPVLCLRPDRFPANSFDSV